MPPVPSCLILTAVETLLELSVKELCPLLSWYQGKKSRETSRKVLVIAILKTQVEFWEAHKETPNSLLDRWIVGNTAKPPTLFTVPSDTSSHPTVFISEVVTSSSPSSSSPSSSSPSSSPSSSSPSSSSPSSSSPSSSSPSSSSPSSKSVADVSSSSSSVVFHTSSCTPIYTSFMSSPTGFVLVPSSAASASSSSSSSAFSTADVDANLPSSSTLSVTTSTPTSLTLTPIITTTTATTIVPHTAANTASQKEPRPKGRPPKRKFFHPPPKNPCKNLSCCLLIGPSVEPEQNSFRLPSLIIMQCVQALLDYRCNTGPGAEDDLRKCARLYVGPVDEVVNMRKNEMIMRILFAHITFWEAKGCVPKTLFDRPRREADYIEIPSVPFCVPPITPPPLEDIVLCELPAAKWTYGSKITEDHLGKSQKAHADIVSPAARIGEETKAVEREKQNKRFQPADVKSVISPQPERSNFVEGVQYIPPAVPTRRWPTDVPRFLPTPPLLPPIRQSNPLAPNTSVKYVSPVIPAKIRKMTKAEAAETEGRLRALLAEIDSTNSVF